LTKIDDLPSGVTLYMRCGSRVFEDVDGAVGGGCDAVQHGGLGIVTAAFGALILEIEAANRVVSAA
jgi:hypothetical protein